MTTINDPLVGTTYDGRYRIERRIGAGGMANVYLAEDETLGRRVAIKVLHQRYAEDSQFIERFTREASAAARLNHPNIVQVYDRGRAEQTYYIAMEFVDGMTLKELVQRRGGLTEQEVLAYGRQALHGLRFAHRNGVVHRDVKPHNMMVDTDGRLKIADFGIARAGADSGLTEAGSIVGTAQYLSPEQAQGHDVSATSDLYSLGVVMYEMATGGVPFDGESPVNVALKHVKDPVPAPSSRKPEVSPALESIILKAMEKESANRYQSADEMLADLDRAREGSATQAMTQVLGGAAIGAATTQVTPITPAAMPPRAYEPVMAPERAWPEERWGDDDPEKTAWRWIIPLMVVLMLAGAALYFLVIAPKGEPVPDVRGLTIAQATTALTGEGFEVGESSREFSDDVPKNRVLGTDPEAGDKAEAGSEVNLVLSDGPPPEDVPDVVGDTEAEAVAELKAAGFGARVVREPSEVEDKGNVIDQAPEPGTELAPGKQVTITVGEGPEKKDVPDVTGMSVGEATSTLEAEGFEVATQDRPSSRPLNEVIDQSPDADTPLGEGSRVTIYVANGTNVVPEVEGLSSDEAQGRLREQAFTFTVDEEDVTDPAQDGIVLRSDPGAGETRDRESTVALVVGRYVGGDEDDEGNGNGPDGEGPPGQED